MDSIASHMSQNTITPLVQHTITLQNPEDPSIAWMVYSTHDTLPARFMWVCLTTSSVATPQHHREADGWSINKETRHPLLFRMLECVWVVWMCSAKQRSISFMILYMKWKKSSLLNFGYLFVISTCKDSIAAHQGEAARQSLCLHNLCAFLLLHIDCQKT